jgi:hypothetical protein
MISMKSLRFNIENPMPAVFISHREQKSGRLELYPDLDPGIADLLQEASEYLIDIEDIHNPEQAELLFDDVRLEALRSPRPQVGRWVWKVGFYSGVVEFTLVRSDGKHTEFRVSVSPDSKKLHDDQFDTMLRNIREDTYELFQMSGYRRAFAAGTRRQPPPLIRLEYLRAKIPEIEQAVETINRHPVRTIQKEIVINPFVRAKHITGKDVSRSLGRERMLHAGEGASVLPPELQGFYPRRLRQRRSVESADIREHREIKGSLLRWTDWLTSAAQLLAGSSDQDAELQLQRVKWAKRCRKLVSRLQRLLSLDLFQNIHPSYRGPAASYIFLRKPAYRKFFRLASNMNVAIAEMFGNFLELPLARTYDLYELWVYLRLVRAALKRRGIRTVKSDEIFVTSALGLTLRGDRLCVDLGGGAELCFQKTFIEYWRMPTRVGTFTHHMRPDISIGLNSGKKLIVLDAKYRVGPALNDAIASIHMYRDALLEAADDTTRRAVIGAYVISPFDPLITAADWPQADMPMRLFHPDFRGKFKFGGISMVPGLSLESVAKGLDLIMQDALG